MAGRNSRNFQDNNSNGNGNPRQTLHSLHDCGCILYCTAVLYSVLTRLFGTGGTPLRTGRLSRSGRFRIQHSTIYIHRAASRWRENETRTTRPKTTKTNVARRRGRERMGRWKRKLGGKRRGDMKRPSVAVHARCKIMHHAVCWAVLGTDLSCR